MITISATTSTLMMTEYPYVRTCEMTCEMVMRWLSTPITVSIMFHTKLFYDNTTLEKFLWLTILE